LVVDDDRDFADGMAEMLGIFDHEVKTAYSGDEAIQMANAAPFDIALIDIGLGDQLGTDCAREIMKRRGAPRCVLVTGYSSEALRKMDVAVADFAVLRKPVNPDDLLSHLTV
jgi:ActR/RegA family two-component response regulator